MHIKDFDGWNTEKKYVNRLEKGVYFSEREVWWCALGVNIGVEIDGKNGRFERPVLVLKYINKDMALVAPLTTKGKFDKYHIQIRTDKMVSFAKLSQVRVASSKRFIRKIDTLPEDQFLALKKNFIEFVC